MERGLNKKDTPCRKVRAFTLIELLVVIAVMAVASVAMLFSGCREGANRGPFQVSSWRLEPIARSCRPVYGVCAFQ